MPVARIGESVSYSDKLREQANLINQRRQQNLNVELAQEDRNRAFREKQIADTYSFDWNKSSLSSRYKWFAG